MEVYSVPSQKYRCVVVDPPWWEPGGGRIKRGSDRHYKILHTKDIKQVILNSPHWQHVGPDAHLWMWSTVNHLPDALTLMQDLGFRYITHIVWVKIKNTFLQKGIGRYIMGSHELCLLGTRGKAMVPKPIDRQPSAFFAERTEHSKKPDEAFMYFESISPGPRLEIFARKNTRPHWDAFGDEV